MFFGGYADEQCAFGVKGYFSPHIALGVNKPYL